MIRILVLFILFTSCSSKNDKPNIIIIMTDDQGYQDLGCYGSPDLETPNIDNIANKGIKLNDFYAAQPICSPSRAALMTGCYPNRLSIYGVFRPSRAEGLNPEETSIAEMLKETGYKTGMFGKWHLGDKPKFRPNKQGFDQFFGILYSNDMWPLHPMQGKYFNFGPLELFDNDKAIDTITDQSLLTKHFTERSVEFINRNADNNFFLYISHTQPHIPLFVSDKFKGKSKKGLYGDVIMEIDWSVGEVLKALRENNIEDNTIIIFTSDNGPWLAYGEHSGSAYPLREGKGTTLEGGVRVPCIIYYPDKIKGKREINTPIMNIDLLPTIADITDSKLPNLEIDGKSVWNILMNKSEESPHNAYFFYHKTNELQGVRYKNWKMYFPHIYITLNGREGGKNGEEVAYDKDTIKQIELYDLSKDIGETKNIAAQNPKIVKKIEVLADEMRVKLGDKLRDVKGKENRPIGNVTKN